MAAEDIRLYRTGLSDHLDRSQLGKADHAHGHSDITDKPLVRTDEVIAHRSLRDGSAGRHASPSSALGSGRETRSREDNHEIEAPAREHRAKSRSTTPASAPEPGVEKETRRKDEPSSNGVRRSGSSRSAEVGESVREEEDVPRTRAQTAVRALSLYFLPFLLAIPTGLLVHLGRVLLRPLYGSSSSHPWASEVMYPCSGLIATLTITYLTRKRGVKKGLSPRLCLCLAALWSDMAVVSGRGVSYLLGGMGRDVGYLLSGILLNLGWLGGTIGFAVLCYEYLLPESITHTSSSLVRGMSIAFRAAFYLGHVYLFEKIWSVMLQTFLPYLDVRPEKVILFMSMLFTLCSLFVKDRTSSPSFGAKVHQSITKRWKLSKDASRQLGEITSLLPKQSYPLFLLLRLPLLILALQHQIFSRSAMPYTTGQVRILASGKGDTGRVVVGESLSGGYRYSRVDDTVVGGRWVRQVSDGQNGTRTDLGDSIFATAILQEIGVLALRTDSTDSLARTISMTTELQIEEDDELVEQADTAQGRALILGLGVGISAGSMIKRGLGVDVVDDEKLVYEHATEHFGLLLPESTSTINTLPVDQYVEQIASMNRDLKGTLQKWSYVVHDCSSNGVIPLKAYSMEFWSDLNEMLEVDALVTVRIPLVSEDGLMRMLAALLSVFAQCRVFASTQGLAVQPDNLQDHVIVCTPAYSPLLTFGSPEPFDVQRSPLRSHVFSNFFKGEVSLSSIFGEDELPDDNLILTNNITRPVDSWRRSETAFWASMRKLMTKEMWVTW